MDLVDATVRDVRAEILAQRQARDLCWSPSPTLSWRLRSPPSRPRTPDFPLGKV